MPVSPDGGSRFAAALAELYGDAAARLMQAVARRLAAGIEEPGWAERKLADTLGVRRDVQGLVARLAGLTDTVAVQSLLASYQAGVVAAGGPGATLAAEGLVATNRGAVVAYARELVEVATSTHTAILRTTEDIYRRVVSEVAGQVATGASTRREVAARAVAKLAQQGISGFTDAAGRRWELGSYVEMATRTASGRAHVQGGLDRFGQQGRYLVVVSDAPEECEVCRPFEGRVLSLTGRAPTSGELGRNRYAGTLADARARGFLHPNCRHALSAFIPGLTRPVTATADPEGDKLRQSQRALERRVRESKRRVAAVEAFGDTQQLRRERDLLRARRTGLKAFNDEHDRKADVSARRVNTTSR